MLVAAYLYGGSVSSPSSTRASRHKTRDHPLPSSAAGGGQSDCHHCRRRADTEDSFLRRSSECDGTLGGAGWRGAEERGVPPCSRPCCVRPVPSRPLRARARTPVRPRPAAASPVPGGARCSARSSKDGGLRAILGAAGLCAAGRLRVGRHLPRLGLPVPRGAELGRQLEGIQLASHPHRHGLRLHPGHRCVGGPGRAGAAGEPGLPGAGAAGGRGRLRAGPGAGDSGSAAVAPRFREASVPGEETKRPL